MCVAVFVLMLHADAGCSACSDVLRLSGHWYVWMILVLLAAGILSVALVVQFACWIWRGLPTARQAREMTHAQLPPTLKPDPPSHLQCHLVKFKNRSRESATVSLEQKNVRDYHVDKTKSPPKWH